MIVSFVRIEAALSSISATAILNLLGVINLLALVSGPGLLQNPEPLGNADKLSQGLHVHFFHDRLPMRLDRSLAAAKFARHACSFCPAR
jgi:hypothetical protein